jgi:CO/xanthine dehydrogenase Mo-binding subunit
VPCNEYGIISQDQPVLCGPGRPNLSPTSCVLAGDKIAHVVGGGGDIAEAPCRLIKIDYEDLPVLDDPLTAMQPGRTPASPP